MSTIVTVPRSVSWKGDAIAVLNQTKLPHSTEYKTLTTIEEVWKSIIMLEVRGAPAIGIVGAFGLALAAKNIILYISKNFKRSLIETVTI